MNLDLTGVLDDADPDEVAGVATPSGPRTCDPEELRGRLAPLLGGYGITRVAHLTGFDHLGVPVHMAIKPQGRTLSSGSGKGVTASASWVSAAMEAIEQSVWECVEPSGVEASEETLRSSGATVVPGHSMPMLRDALWSERLPIRWRAGWDIVRGEQVWIPDALVTYRWNGLSPFFSSSNGLASGVQVLEAIHSGLQEVIERDGLALRTRATHGEYVDARDCLAAIAPELAERIERAAVRMEVIDATTELGVPTYACYFRDAPGERLGSFKGAGAGADAATALVRAVTEAAQGRTLTVAGARDDIFASMRRSSLNYTARRREPGARLVGVERPAVGARRGIRDSLAWLAGRLVARGFARIVVVRHTTPADPVQVVRVVVPGLEGYPSPSAALGPRALAWRASSLHTGAHR